MPQGAYGTSGYEPLFLRVAKALLGSNSNPDARLLIAVTPTVSRSEPCGNGLDAQRRLQRRADAAASASRRGCWCSS
jgi:hypothetical protein